MRSKNAMRNATLSFSYELILVIFGLIVPKLIIKTYGDAVNGLTGTINQILNIINLLQAGAAGAFIFRMFKPVAEKNYEEVSKVLYASKRYFRKIGYVFLGLVLLVGPIFAFFKQVGNLDWIEIFLGFVILGVNGAFYLLFISWYDILFSPHQKRYILAIASIIERLIYYLLVFVIIYLKLHFIFMYVSVLAGTLIKMAILYAVYAKHYKALISKDKSDEKFVVKNKGYLLCNQIASQATDSSPMVILSSIYDFNYASIYAVYHLIQNMIKMLVRTIQLSVSEVFGNLVNTAKEDKIKRVYNLLECIFTLVGTFLCGCALALFMPFINVYTNLDTIGNGISYIVPLLAILIVVYGLTYCMYMPLFTLINVYGLFKETYMQAVVCAIIGLVASIAGCFISWPLVMLGPIFYYASSIVYRAVVACKRISWMNIGKYVRRIVFALLTCIAVYLISEYVVYANGYVTSWIQWIVHGFITAGAVGAILLIYVAIFERKEIKALFGYAKNLLKKKRKPSVAK